MRLPLALTLALSFSTIASDLHVYVDQSVLQDYSDKEVREHINLLVLHGNEALTETRYARGIASLTYLNSHNTFKDPMLELHALDSDKANHHHVHNLFFESPSAYKTIRDVRHKKDDYVVFFGYNRGFTAHCGAALQPSLNTEDANVPRYAVLAFDPIGRCSYNWLLTHELGHIDGLGHNDARCTDGSLNIMASKGYGIQDSRTHLLGSSKCRTSQENHIQQYRTKKRSARPVSSVGGDIKIHDHTISSHGDQLILVINASNHSPRKLKADVFIDYESLFGNLKKRQSINIGTVSLSPSRTNQALYISLNSDTAIGASQMLENNLGKLRLSYL